MTKPSLIFFQWLFVAVLKEKANPVRLSLFFSMEKDMALSIWELKEFMLTEATILSTFWTSFS